MAKVRLQGPGIDAIAGQLVAAGVPQHMSMHFDAKVGRNAGPFDHTRVQRTRKRWLR